MIVGRLNRATASSTSWESVRFGHRSLCSQLRSARSISSAPCPERSSAKSTVMGLLSSAAQLMGIDLLRSSSYQVGAPRATKAASAVDLPVPGAPRTRKRPPVELRSHRSISSGGCGSLNPGIDSRRSRKVRSRWGTGTASAASRSPFVDGKPSLGARCSRSSANGCCSASSRARPDGSAKSACTRPVPVCSAR